jgi:hypothetical protein
MASRDAALTLQLSYWGGLGDVIGHIHGFSCYKSLDLMAQDDKALVFLVSHNPAAREFFLWHPKRSQIEVHEIGFRPDWLDPDVRFKLGFTAATDCDHVRGLQDVNFYPSKADLKIIEHLNTIGRYVVFAPSAGAVERYIPKGIVEDAADLARKMGFKAVVIGKSYTPTFVGMDSAHMRSEMLVNESPNVIDLTNQLTAPGSMKVIQSAAGVFSSHSFACQASFHLNRPTFLVYDQYTHENCQPKDGKSCSAYLFGVDRRGNDHMWFHDYGSIRFKAFLEALK